MPEEKDSPGFTPDKARPVHHVGLPIQDRREQFWILPRIIFQIGVLDQDDISPGLRNAGEKRRPLALIPGLKQDFAVSPIRLLREDFPRAVCRTVIHDDDFFLQIFGEGAFLDAG